MAMVRVLQKTLVVVLICSTPVIGYLLYTAGYFSYTEPIQPGSALITFNQKVPLRVSVVRNEEELRRGLSGQSSLGPTDGMLFVFPNDDYHGIWMKDMNFLIDIVWIDKDRKVVHIEESVRPDTYPNIFEPTVPARFVIEANAHYMSSFNVHVGATVEIPEDVLPVDLQKK